MPRFIVKYTVDNTDLYLVWSTIVDAPVTSASTLEGMRRYWREEYGRRGLEDLDRDIANDQRWFTPLTEVIECNRAGDGETALSLEQIVDFYFVRRCDGERPTGQCRA